MEEVKQPEGTDFVLTVPLKRDKSKTATFFLKDIDDEGLFLAFKDMVSKGKTTEAIRLMIKQLSLPGSDDVKTLNFLGVQSAGTFILELITPLDADVKKN